MNTEFRRAQSQPERTSRPSASNQPIVEEWSERNSYTRANFSQRTEPSSIIAAFSPQVSRGSAASTAVWCAADSKFAEGLREVSFVFTLTVADETIGPFQQKSMI